MLAYVLIKTSLVQCIACFSSVRVFFLRNSGKLKFLVCECLKLVMSLLYKWCFKCQKIVLFINLVLFLCNACVFGLNSRQKSNFKGYYKSSPSDVLEVYPKKISQQGNHISSHKLDSSHSEKTVFYNVTINKKEHTLKLVPSAKFLAPNIIIERRGLGTYKKYKPSEKNVNCHFKGEILGNVGPSQVAISACNGLVGFIHLPDEKFYIEPAHYDPEKIQEENGHKHLIFKRSAIYNANKKKRRKKRFQSKNCGTKEPRKVTLVEWTKNKGKLKIQHKKHAKYHLRKKHNFLKINQKQTKKQRFKNKNRIRRSVSKPQFVEVLLVADFSMLEFHEDIDVETYLLTIMNMVSTIYTDPSIGNLFKIYVVKIILIDDPQAEPNLNVTTNADSSLHSFCKWQKTLNPENDTHPHHHDVAILVTRKDICANSNSSLACNTLGVAHVGGVCRSERSCSVNEDNGITLAHTIAHELGHSLGMYHDTDKIGCKGRQGDIQHIMTPSFQADTIGVSWSSCSRRDVTRFLDKGLAKCLLDEPQKLDEYDYPGLPPGAMFDANHQCKLQFGEEAIFCSPKEEICDRLWCTVNETCTTQLIPPAPGTQCGKHKWCQNQKCVSIMEPPIPIDGGWGEWSGWSECSRSCGAGVSISQRKCDHPTPADGGLFCVGARKRYRMCNSEPCPVNTPNFRSEQCSVYDNHTYNGDLYKWVPYFDPSEPCKLYCSDINDTIIVPWSDYVKDGTPCNLGTRDVCIAGICRKVGCDWVVDSKAHEDECGICQGDNTKCDSVTGVYEKQSTLPGYREIVVIPPGARNIHIEEKNHSNNYLAIASTYKKLYYLNGQRQITLPGEYNIGGAQALYERKSKEKIIIPGPINESIVVMAIFNGKTYNPGITYRYSVWKPESTKQVEYKWALSDWSQCTATCGGGVQSRTPLCKETPVSTMNVLLNSEAVIVDELNCDPEEKITKLFRACNDDACPTHWWVGPWQSCPVTCAKKNSKPYKRRSVMCVDGKEMALPDQFCDKKKKPREYELCRSLPTCLED